MPNAQAGVETSAFTIVFEKLGLAGAASIMNAIILTSVLSPVILVCMHQVECFMPWLKVEWHLRFLKKTNSRGVPVNAIIITTIIASLCFLTGIYAENTVYVWLVANIGIIRIYSLAWNRNMSL